jgi:tripeptide aminopeptidase
MSLYTSPLAESLAPELLRRFCDYVRIDTQSTRDRTASPSTPGQLDLARLLVSELHGAGLADAAVDDNGYVTASLAPSAAGDGAAPVIGLIAHMDTSPDAPGAGVAPLVHRGYDGGAIELPRSGTVLDPQRMPELAAKRGHDIVTASGDTLLGADDKAGVAEIVTAVAHLAAHRSCRVPRSGSASRPTRRSARARRCSTSSASAPVAPTRSTAPSSGGSRTRRSPATRRS